ncbi:MAG: hypothetical protein ACOCV2_04905 [Persicimonas sp.]
MKVSAVESIACSFVLLVVFGCGTSTDDGWGGGDEPYRVESSAPTTAYDMATAIQRYAIDTDLTDFDACVRLQLTDSEESQEGDRIGVEMPEDWTFSASLYEGACTRSFEHDDLIGAVESAEGSVELLEEDDQLEGFSVDVDVIFDHERDTLPTRFLIEFDEVALDS